MQKMYGNPSSLHKLGLEAEKEITAARSCIAQFMGAVPSEIIFTSGATESNNIALYGAANAYVRRGKKIITTAFEHSSILSPLKHLEQEGWEIHPIKLDKHQTGTIEDEIINIVDEKTTLITLSALNNETGMRIDVHRIVREVKRKYPDVIIHIDAAQFFCKYPLNANRLGADLISVSGHKLGAPPGIGALFLKEKTRITPLMRGGEQEKGIRPGTQSLPLIAGFAAAVKYVYPDIKTNLEHYKSLNMHLRKQLASISANTDARNTGFIRIISKEDAAPHIMCFATNTVKSEIMLHYLEQHDIYVSSGSACGRGKPSHVLTAMNLCPQEIDTALRISFSRETSIEDINEFVNRLKAGMEFLA